MILASINQPCHFVTEYAVLPEAIWSRDPNFFVKLLSLPAPSTFGVLFSDVHPHENELFLRPNERHTSESAQ